MSVIKTEFGLSSAQIANINIAAVGITILVRLVLGPLCGKILAATDVHGAPGAGRGAGAARGRRRGGERQARRLGGVITYAASCGVELFVHDVAGSFGLLALFGRARRHRV